MMNTDWEAAAGLLGQSDDYRVLRRLKELKAATNDPVVPVFRGVFLDVETTGLDTAKDEIIELCLWPFQFTKTGEIVEFAAPHQWYNQPKRPITDETSKLTGINSAAVAGRQIDINAMNQVLAFTTLIIAHNAAFDRPMLERISPDICKRRPWGCSMSQVPWKANGITGSRLEYILSSLGMFYNAHGAVQDCMAGLRALQHRLGDKTALGYILDAVREPMWHVWAIGAAFDYKDALKARGYYWNPGDDGRAKAWHKEIADADADQERDWLAANIYRGQIKARFYKVTAFDRFTSRG